MPKELWVWYLGAIGKDGKILDTKVNAYRRFSGNRRLGWQILSVIYKNTDEELVSRGFGYGAGLDFAIELAVKNAGHLTCFWDPDLTSLEIDIDPLRVLARLTTTLLLEPGETRLFAKEPGEGVVQIPQCHLKRLRIGLFEPFVGCLLLLQHSVLKVKVAQRLACFSIVLALGFKSLVVDVAHRTHRLGEVLLLLLIWVDAVFVGS